MNGMEMMIGSLLKSMNIDPEKIKAIAETVQTGVTTIRIDLAETKERVKLLEVGLQDALGLLRKLTDEATDNSGAIVFLPNGSTKSGELSELLTPVHSLE